MVWGQALLSLGGQQLVAFAKAPSSEFYPLYEQVWQSAVSIWPGFMCLVCRLCLGMQIHMCCSTCFPRAHCHKPPPPPPPFPAPALQRIDDDCHTGSGALLPVGHAVGDMAAWPRATAPVLPCPSHPTALLLHHCQRGCARWGWLVCQPGPLKVGRCL